MPVRAARGARSVRAWEFWTLPRPLLAGLLLLHGVTAWVVVTAAASGFDVAGRDVAYAGVAVFGVVASRMHAAWISVEAEHDYGPGQRIQNSADDCWLAAIALGVPLGLGVGAALTFQLLNALIHRFAHRVSPTRWTEPGKPNRVAFNTSSNVLAVAAAHVVFVTVAGGTTLSARAVVGAAAAIVTLQAVILGLLLVVLRLVTHARWRALFAGEIGITLAQMSQESLGVLIWAAWGSAQWSVVFVFPLLLSFERAQRHRSLLDRAQSDAKTGLANLSYWQARAEATLARNQLAGATAAVLLVDLDHFKRVNDTHGHLVGDEVLVAAADRIAGAVRPADIVGRFGGEEFAVFLSPADLDEAMAVAERIRTAVSHTPTTTTSDGTEVSVTCSVGVAEVAGGAPVDLTEALGRADLALYVAKEAGRDRVEVAPPQPDERTSAPAHVRWV